MMNIAQLAGPIVGGALLEVGGVKTPFILMGGIQTIMAFIALPFLPDYDGVTSQFSSALNLKHFNFDSFISVTI
jgi:hypothetical protein